MPRQRRNRSGEYSISPNTRNKEKLKKLREMVAVSASESNDLTRTILPHTCFGAKLLEAMRSGKLKIRADLKDQLRPAEESE